MGPSRSLLIRSASVSALLLATLTSSCRDSAELTAPAALAAKGGNGGPSVSGVVPDSSERGVTLDVTVSGSGFDQGSTVRLERQGVPATGITTNTTTYVTSRKLIANVTIATDADTGKYDVAVISPMGRKGVGIELFTVTYEIAELGILGGSWSRAHAINDQGEVVGASCTNDCLSTAFYWSTSTGQIDLGGLPGYTRSAAAAINNKGQVFGTVTCRPEDEGCGGVYREQLVRWDRVDGVWSISPVDGCSVVRPMGDASLKFVINNNGECVRQKPLGALAVQRLSGSGAVDQAYLPPLSAGASSYAYGISDAPMVVGFSGGEGRPRVPVLWYRNGTGIWAILPLTIPGSDDRGTALGISEPDGTGRVRVAGYTYDIEAKTFSGSNHAVRWTLQPDGTGSWQVVLVEVLPQAQTGRATNGWATAVNSAGDAAGNSGGYVDSSNPAVWGATGGVELLPNSAGGSRGRAVDINSSGWIVGAVWDSKNNCDRAAIWRQR